MAKVAINLSQDSQNKITQFLSGVLGKYKLTDNIRERMELVDRKYYMELSDQAKKKNVKGKLDPTVTPTIISHVETVVAQLTDTFLGGYPIFSPITSPDNQQHQDALVACFAKQEKDHNWRSNLLNLFRDFAKYNRGFAEVDWSTRKINGITPEDGTQTVGTVEITGNTIKRLDPYNTFFDETVSLDDLAKYGQFAGYIERMSNTRLKMLLEDLEEGPATVHNKKKILDSKCSGNPDGYFFVPDILPDSMKSDIDNTWEGFFGNTEEVEDPQRTSSLRYVATLYLRAIPKELGLNVAQGDKMQIFKFKIVDGQWIASIQILTNMHGLFPILAASAQDSKLKTQAKSIAEMLIPIQDLTTDFHTARLATIKRSVGDRLLYNSKGIRAGDINSPNPASKIAVRNIPLETPLNNLVYQIPFRDDSAQYIISEANIIESYGNRITGQNPAAQGQHIPGNKTVSEFQTIMANSSSRSITISICLEADFFTPLKNIILYNTIQYQEQENYYDTETRSSLQYNPIDIRRISWDFDVADGSLPISKIANTQAWLQLLQYVTQIPQLGNEYKIAPMFSFVFKLLGVRGMSQFEKTEEEKMQELQQQIALMNAQNNPQQNQTTQQEQ